MFREALNKSDFVVAQCLAHKKYLLTYHLYAASIFFVRALPHLELELIQSFLRTTSASNALRAVGLGEILIKCAQRQMADLARDF